MDDDRYKQHINAHPKRKCWRFVELKLKLQVAFTAAAVGNFPDQTLFGRGHGPITYSASSK